MSVRSKHRSYCPVGPSGCNHRFPSRWTRNSLPANNLCHLSYHIQPQVPRDPTLLPCYLLKSFMRLKIIFVERLSKNSLLTASGVVVNSVWVEGEGLVRCVDGDRDGSVLSDRESQGFRITMTYVDKASHLRSQSCVVYVAVSILKFDDKLPSVVYPSHKTNQIVAYYLSHVTAVFILQR